MSDRYQGSAYRGHGPPRDDRRYAPRRDDRDYPEPRYADHRDPYASSYYPDSRGYSDRPPRRVHKTIPPPRPWDYSRRPLPRNEQERIELEREREAWEAKEAERYRQRMEERERERERDRERGGGARHGGWEREYEADERMYRPPVDGYGHPPSGPRRQRSRSPAHDPRYEPRSSWGRASVGSAEGRERELERPAGPSGADRGPPDASRYPDNMDRARRSPPPAASQIDAPDGPRCAGGPERPLSPRGTPRGPASRPTDSGFSSTPPTGPRASRGGPPPMPSSGFRSGRDGPGAAGPYTPGSDRDRDAYHSPSLSRFPRSSRDGAHPAAYRGGHPSFGRRRDTNPYDSYFAGGPDEEAYRSSGYDRHSGSSPHEASPFSPSTSTPGGGHLAPRLSRTSSAQTPTTPAIPTGPSASSSAIAGGAGAGIASPSSAQQQPTVAPSARFSAAYKLCPELDAELHALETTRTTFIANYVLGSKRTAIRSARAELRDAEIEYTSAANRRLAAERALEVAKETADAYSLEENRKEQLQNLLLQQQQQQQQQQLLASS